MSSVAGIMKSIKGSSSHWLNDSARMKEQFAWQEGYAAFTVSTSSLSGVKRYIEHQEDHHRNMSLRDEMIKLFQKHRVGFREQDLDF